MTSEVCLMNRHAVVLAADSATTVSGWFAGSKETRYFKGANKILQLSECNPVGLMIFAGADILNVPWEVAVKAFRAHLGNKSFNDIRGYASEFFAFLEGDVRLFPVDVQNEAVKDAASSVGYGVGLQVSKNPAIDRADWTQALDALIVSRRAVQDAAPLHPALPRDICDMVVAAMLAEVEQELRGLFGDPDEPQPSDFVALAELAVWTVLKQPADNLGTTGLVFAGYGDHDPFPSHVHYISAGVVGGKHVGHEEGDAAITHSNPADLTAFAQKGMIETFQMGLDVNVYSDAMTSFDQAISAFGSEVIAQSGGDATQVPDLEALTKNARKVFSDQWLDGARFRHALPLRRVLASLPITEMADLAETLVNLQSLKEKVTKPSEEVGGPIDVAVITKAEGLIWIKRKHYFDPSLNARYMARLGEVHR